VKILALDIATTTGFAIGDPAMRCPHFGSIRFASAGASHAAIFADALAWASEQLLQWQPQRLIYEEPLQFRGGKSRAGNDEILHGLPAVFLAVAHLRGIHDIRKASVKAIRMHFIGANPPRVEAKRKTVQQCRTIGWAVTDDNQGDACALWSYACGLQKLEETLAPKAQPAPMWS
jgi:hypothetical protein